MISISLCMIVKNEEDVLARCLDSIKDIADEIIIVDTGSTDKTIEIAKLYTDKVYSFKWIQDFAAARNYSFSKATKEYIMWLDADDILNEYNKKGLQNLKSCLNNDIDIVMMKYAVAFDEYDNITFSYYRERIFKRANQYKWVGEIHEAISLSGKIEYRDLAIFHKKINPNEPNRNLDIFKKIINEGKILEPRQKFYYARELYYNKEYYSAIDIFNEFLASGDGWIENNISACRDLAICYFNIDNSAFALQALFKSFIFSSPRAEICCDIGKYFFDTQRYDIAIFWYEMATNIKMDETNGGFYSIDCYGFIPYMQLCVCYDKIGDLKKAYEYNEKARMLKGNDKNVLYNIEYFNKIFNNTME